MTIVIVATVPVAPASQPEGPQQSPYVLVVPATTSVEDVVPAITSVAD